MLASSSVKEVRQSHNKMVGLKCAPPLLNRVIAWLPMRRTIFSRCHTRLNSWYINYTHQLTEITSSDCSYLRAKNLRQSNLTSKHIPGIHHSRERGINAVHHTAYIASLPLLVSNITNIFPFSDHLPLI